MFIQWWDCYAWKISNHEWLFSLLVKGKAATAILRLTVLNPGQLTADRNRGFTEGLTWTQYSISCCFSPLENCQNGVVTHNPMFYILPLFWAGRLLLRVTVKLLLVATVQLMLDFIKSDSTTGSSFSPGMQVDTESLACFSLVKWEYRSSHTTFKSFGSIGWLCTACFQKDMRRNIYPFPEW